MILHQWLTPKNQGNFGLVKRLEAVGRPAIPAHRAL
jgi:hypothetical protein